MGGLGAGLTVGVVMAALAGLFLRAELRFLRFASPGGVLRHLRKSPTGTYEVRLSTMGWAWDPTPGASASVNAGRIYGPGVARYKLGPEDRVSLTVQRRDGSLRHAEGPIPPFLVHGTSEARRVRNIKRGVLAALSIYPAGGIAGAFIGAHLASHTGSHTRDGYTVVGFFIGLLVVSILAHIATVVFSIATGNRRARSPSQPGA